MDTSQMTSSQLMELFGNAFNVDGMKEIQFTREQQEDILRGAVERVQWYIGRRKSGNIMSIEDAYRNMRNWIGPNTDYGRFHRDIQWSYEITSRFFTAVHTIIEQATHRRQMLGQQTSQSHAPEQSHIQSALGPGIQPPFPSHSSINHQDRIPQQPSIITEIAGLPEGRNKDISSKRKRDESPDKYPTSQPVDKGKRRALFVEDPAPLSARVRSSPVIPRENVQNFPGTESQDEDEDVEENEEGEEEENMQGYHSDEAIFGEDLVGDDLFGELPLPQASAQEIPATRGEEVQDPIIPEPVFEKKGPPQSPQWARDMPPHLYNAEALPNSQVRQPQSDVSEPSSSTGQTAEHPRPPLFVDPTTGHSFMATQRRLHSMLAEVHREGVTLTPHDRVQINLGLAYLKNRDNNNELSLIDRSPSLKDPQPDGRPASSNLAKAANTALYSLAQAGTLAANMKPAFRPSAIADEEVAPRGRPRRNEGLGRTSSMSAKERKSSVSRASRASQPLRAIAPAPPAASSIHKLASSIITPGNNRPIQPSTLPFVREHSSNNAHEGSQKAIMELGPASVALGGASSAAEEMPLDMIAVANNQANVNSSTSSRQSQEEMQVGRSMIPGQGPGQDQHRISHVATNQRNSHYAFGVQGNVVPAQRNVSTSAGAAENAYRQIAPKPVQQPHPPVEACSNLRYSQDIPNRSGALPQLSPRQTSSGYVIGVGSNGQSYGKLPQQTPPPRYIQGLSRHSNDLISSPTLPSVPHSQRNSLSSPARSQGLGRSQLSYDSPMIFKSSPGHPQMTPIATPCQPPATHQRSTPLQRVIGDAPREAAPSTLAVTGQARGEKAARNATPANVSFSPSPIEAVPSLNSVANIYTPLSQHTPQISPAAASAAPVTTPASQPVHGLTTQPNDGELNFSEEFTLLLNKDNSNVIDWDALLSRYASGPLPPPEVEAGQFKDESTTFLTLEQQQRLHELQALAGDITLYDQVEQVGGPFNSSQELNGYEASTQDQRQQSYSQQLLNQQMLQMQMQGQLDYDQQQQDQQLVPLQQGVNHGQYTSQSQ